MQNQVETPNELITHDIEAALSSANNPQELQCTVRCIFYITELNHVRLYWLWTKYVFLSGIDQKWCYTEQSESILKAFSPTMDNLSYSFYLTRIGLMAYFLKNTTEPGGLEARDHRTQILSDVLWSLSNILSITCLETPDMRPAAFTFGWWGNMSMQILLLYDLLTLSIQYCSISTLHCESTDVLFRQKSLRVQIIYASFLVIGFCMFRGFFISRNRINPFIGSLSCLMMTVITNNLEWFNLMGKYHQLRKTVKPQSLTCNNGLIFACILINTLFPIVSWGALQTSNPSFIVACFLICMASLNICAKQNILMSKSSIVPFSLFCQGRESCTIDDKKQFSVDTM